MTDGSENTFFSRIVFVLALGEDLDEIGSIRQKAVINFTFWRFITFLDWNCGWRGYFRKLFLLFLTVSCLIEIRKIRKLILSFEKKLIWFSFQISDSFQKNWFSSCYTQKIDFFFSCWLVPIYISLRQVLIFEIVKLEFANDNKKTMRKPKFNIHQLDVYSYSFPRVASEYFNYLRMSYKHLKLHCILSSLFPSYPLPWKVSIVNIVKLKGWEDKIMRLKIL